MGLFVLFCCLFHFASVNPVCILDNAYLFGCDFVLLLYRTSVKSQGMKQLMAGGGVALIGITLIPLLSGLFG